MVEVINVSSTLGLATSRRTMLEGGTVRNSFAGFSNEIGLRAWDMVDAGFVGEADGIGTVYGTVIADQFQPDEMVADLGTRWEIARNYFKRHAACRYNHGALDALQRLVAKAGGRLKPDDIARIDVDTYIWAAQLDGDAAAQHAGGEVLAAVFAGDHDRQWRGHRSRRFATRRGAMPSTLALAKRVTVREDKALTAMLPGLRPARVRITLTDGRVLQAEALTNRAIPRIPTARAEIREKFHEVAGPVWSDAHCAAILAAVDGPGPVARSPRAVPSARGLIGGHDV